MRLIDADNLWFRCSYDGDCMSDNCEECSEYSCGFGDVQNVPTAYDVDKVVEGLKRSVVAKPVGGSEPCELIALKDAVEIVKKGGVDDDVCMWREEGLGLITSCGNIVRAYSDDFEYCPYCSRKIEVMK